MSWLRFFLPMLLLNLLVDVPRGEPEPWLKRYGRNACRLGMLILLISFLGRKLSLGSLGLGLFGVGLILYLISTRLVHGKTQKNRSDDHSG